MRAGENAARLAQRIGTGKRAMAHIRPKIADIRAVFPDDPQSQGILYGGMWSVALTTFFQMIVIGLGLVTWLPMEFLLPESEGPIPPQFAGFLMAVRGMPAG